MNNTKVGVVQRIKEHSETGFPSKNVSTKPRLQLLVLLAAPLTWFILVYLVSLLALLATAFLTVDSFTGQIRAEWTFDNVVQVATGSLYQTVTIRSLMIAFLVTLIDVVLAIPVAGFMAFVASPRLQRFLVVSLLTPLWVSYLVKAYAWRVMLSENGIADSALATFGLNSFGFGVPATVLTLSYLWLPFVVLPIYAGMQRIKPSLLEASSDLGGTNSHTWRMIIFPLIAPSILAGSILSFSLTLGDYLAVNIVGGTTQMLGNLVYTNVGAANNLPLAAAISFIPIFVVLFLLAVMRKTGAFNDV